MTTPIRESVIAAILGKLEALATDFPGLAVERERDAEVEAFPSLILFDTGQDPDDSLLSIVTYDLSIEIEAYCEAATGALAATAINELSAAVTAAMTADNELDDTALDVREGSETQEIQTGGSRAIKAAKLSFVVRYQTVAGDPYTAA